jgi:hypothetical protein
VRPSSRQAQCSVQGQLEAVVAVSRQRRGRRRAGASLWGRDSSRQRLTRSTAGRRSAPGQGQRAGAALRCSTRRAMWRRGALGFDILRSQSSPRGGIWLSGGGGSHTYPWRTGPSLPGLNFLFTFLLLY